MKDIHFTIAQVDTRPAPFYLLHDYTKLVYLSPSHLCIRELVHPQDCRPSFLQIKEKDVFGLIQMNNKIGVIGCREGKYGIGWYGSTEHWTALNINTQLLNNVTGLTAKSSSIGRESNLLRQGSTIRESVQSPRNSTKTTPQTYYINAQGCSLLFISFRNACEIYAINQQTCSCISVHYIPSFHSPPAYLASPSSSFFSIVSSSQLKLYEIESLATGIISQKTAIDLGSLDAKAHCWVKEQLIIVGSSAIQVRVQGKVIQKMHEGGEICKEIVGGFIVCDLSQMKIYKKSQNSYDLASRFMIDDCRGISSLQLSPQQDIFAYYHHPSSSIKYSLNFDPSQLQNNSVDLQNKQHTYSTPLLHSITYNQYGNPQHKSTLSKIYQSSAHQNLIMRTHENVLQIISPSTYQCYMAVEISQGGEGKIKVKKATTLLIEHENNIKQENIDGVRIQYAALHPVLPLITLAFKSCIRVYSVLYNQIKMMKEISVGHCREVGFSHGGVYMYALVGGKQGSKVYLYNALSSGFSQIQILSLPRRIIKLYWSNHDSTLHALTTKSHSNWSIASNFKQRVDSEDYKFDIKGGFFDEKDALWIYGEKEIRQTQGIDRIKIDLGCLSQIFVQNNWYIFVMANGQLLRSKDIQSINSLIGKGFKLQSMEVQPIRSNILACQTVSSNIYYLQWGNIDKNYQQIVGIQRRRIIKYQSEYEKYQSNIIQLQQKLADTVQHIMQDFHLKEKQMAAAFYRQLQDRQERYLSIRNEKNKVQQSMEQNIAIHEKETLQQVKELERIYERKIALTTNKLLTSEQINYRNRLLAENNLKLLQEKHGDDIIAIRKEYAEAIASNLFEKDSHKEQLFLMKKEYQTKLAELEQQNELILKNYQQSTEGNIQNLKNNVVNLELKLSQAVSQKYNLERDLQDLMIKIQGYKAKTEYLEKRFKEQERRCAHLSGDYSVIEQTLIEKDKTIDCLEKRIQDLNKSNEIFKYRIVEMKNINDPKEEQISKLKENMTELEEQYDKVIKKAHQNEQILGIFKKQNSKLKQSIVIAQNKQKKIEKNYGMIIDKVRDATKSPIQQIRKLLLKILQIFDFDNNTSTTNEHKRSTSPLGQLNRMRQHLQVCLVEAIDSGKKTQQQKNVQISKKNRQNSQLLQEINDLRRKIRKIQTESRQKDARYQSLMRGQIAPMTSSLSHKEEKQTTNFDSGTKEIKNKTRQSFFERSLFKNHWNQKRLKTQQSNRRKKSSHSLAREHTNHLQIEHRAEDTDELRRIIEQKEAIIKQLINKIHRLS